MVLRMRLGPVSGDLLDIVVDRIEQWPRMAEPPALDEVAGPAR
jgi:hypothetical protein